MQADYVVVSQNGWSTLPASVGVAAGRAPGVTAATSIRRERGRVLGNGVDISGVDPATIDELYRLQWEEGSPGVLRTLGPNDAILRESFANDYGFAVGGWFIVRTPTGEMLDLRVAGIYTPPRSTRCSEASSSRTRRSTVVRSAERLADAPGIGRRRIGSRHRSRRIRMRAC